MLEALVGAQSHPSSRTPRSIQEWCALFNQTARELREDATLSERTLFRWMAGESRTPSASARRVAAIVWKLDFDQLVSAPPAGLETPAAVESAMQDLDKEIAMATEDSARFIKRGVGGVDDTVLEQLHTDVSRLAQRLLNEPPLQLISELTATNREVFDKIDARPRPRYLADLYLIAGQVSALLAHACADLGRPYDAETHARAAWRCADYSEDQHLQAYVRWVQAQIAYWSRDYKRAAQYAESGLADMTDPSTRLRLASQLARIRAAQSDAPAALSALDIAVDAEGRVAPVSVTPSVMHFDRGKFLYYASEVHLALTGPSHGRKALDFAESALTVFDDTSPKDFIAAAEIDAAQAHLRLGDLDAAAARITSVLMLPVEMRTTPVVSRVTKAAHALTALAPTAHATRELPDRLNLFARYTAETSRE